MMNRSGLFSLVVSSSWLEGNAKTLVESEVLHGNQLRCKKWSILDYLLHSSIFRLAWFRYVSISF